MQSFWRVMIVMLALASAGVARGEVGVWHSVMMAGALQAQTAGPEDAAGAQRVAADRAAERSERHRKRDWLYGLGAVLVIALVVQIRRRRGQTGLL